ncbi:iron chelate uptake ABC transporter family permease subunit [[Brevibacterium] frigoritolerans]|uniref:Iron chelate uptake ABC transporter family permease subunit n=1 Tax=Peribacillus frigoritolerans TaxID=450367 RepID=A0A941FGC1_9BACI|nr:iron chelate uptake ABC transporter family permease subunit [Peribacillus frigoritolerans]
MQSQTFILHNYRIPRILIAVIVGAGLATAGAILQGVLRNPLASPDVIGVTKGAGLAAVIVIVLFPQSPIIILPLSAFIGAAVMAAILMIFVYKRSTTKYDSFGRNRFRGHMSSWNRVFHGQVPG